ncbi:hypothetical protein [Sulfuriroseicoccus oceanibius]|uniref:PEP-CTERM protein-sorting domain-containing protein n=1 Tax=Sulfuriroseicoccus oceanibius TaxID=2707525 RepID=A0A6B3LGH1_9BACT|nr:hypothetical protein [Sulfuriroseicoccus oceanibius]QQL45755.1 hypothetical protein G3M56_003985 [Sulfuriroseicoccus oceanibius]
MKRMNQWMMGAATACAIAVTADAAVVFSGTDGTLDFDAVSGSYSLGGVEVTVSANIGSVNATSSGLGINHPSAGDPTAQLDTVNAVEILTFIFNKDVLFESVTIAGVGASDALGVQFDGGATTLLDSSGEHVFGTFVAAGQTVTLAAAAPDDPTPNNGVGITAFTVTAVPEPSAAGLALCGGLGLMLRRRR